MFYMIDQIAGAEVFYFLSKYLLLFSNRAYNLKKLRLLCSVYTVQ